MENDIFLFQLLVRFDMSFKHSLDNFGVNFLFCKLSVSLQIFSLGVLVVLFLVGMKTLC